MDPVTLVSALLFLAKLCGLETKEKRDHVQATLAGLGEAQHTLSELEPTVMAKVDELRDTVNTIAVERVQRALTEAGEPRLSFGCDEQAVLIRALLVAKQRAANVVLALVVRYRFGPAKVATHGFASLTADPVAATVAKVDRFRRALARAARFKDKTCYVLTTVRGRHDPDVEAVCNAALTTIAHDVCALPANLELCDATRTRYEAAGAKTVVLYTPPVARLAAKDGDGGDGDGEGKANDVKNALQRSEFDRLSRIFLLGDTRTGKSTLGNALLQGDMFTVAKGTTGTLRIHRGESTMHSANDEVHVTEVYDTPGLNDKDGLDVLYQALIEDHIRKLQQASALVMTISVDGGLTNSLRDSLATYRALFGDCTASMLLVVLTTNEERVDAEELEAQRDFYWPDLSALDGGLAESSVFCVSLADLRARDATRASHAVLQTLRHHCKKKPMQMIDALRRRYDALHGALRAKTADVAERLQALQNDGWMAYYELAEQYEIGPFVKVAAKSRGGLFNGFVLKHTDKWKRRVMGTTVSMVSYVREVAVVVDLCGQRAVDAWEAFVRQCTGHRFDPDRMRLFGDKVHGDGLGIIVAHRGVSRYATLHLMRYRVSVYDPQEEACDEISAFVENMLENTGDELSEEVMNSLINSSVPAAVRGRMDASVSGSADASSRSSFG